MKDIFRDQKIDMALLAKIEKMKTARVNYMLAITPRSGSSFLCDVIKKTKVLGHPDEFLNQEFIPNQLAKRAPARSADEYLVNVMKAWKTSNGASGVKASWFQFVLLYRGLADKTFVHNLKYVYLTRKDVVLQAVSLYRATETSVFHSVGKHGEAALDKLKKLDYDYEKIDQWCEHILRQEAGWEDYFEKNNIVPMRIDYDEVSANWPTLVKEIGQFVGLREYGLKLIEKSIGEVVPRFEKISDGRSAEWAHRYLIERKTKKSHVNKRWASRFK